MDPIGGGGEGTDTPAEQPTAPPEPSTAPAPSEVPVEVTPVEPEPQPDPDPIEPPQDQIREPEVVTPPNTGGVQNWRVYEMSETAAELGNIETPGALRAVGLSALALLLLSGGGFAAVFYLELGRRKK